MKPKKVEIVKTNGKRWVKVTFDDGNEWYPGIITIGQILSGIGKCEDEKYPNGQGWLFTKRFIDKCWGKTRAQIQELYYQHFDPNGTDADKKIDAKQKSADEETLTEIANEGWSHNED